MELSQPDQDYTLAIDRSVTIDSILSLDKRLTREYLVTLTTDALHDLEESILDTLYEKP